MPERWKRQPFQAWRVLRNLICLATRWCQRRRFHWNKPSSEKNSSESEQRPFSTASARPACSQLVQMRIIGHCATVKSMVSWGCSRRRDSCGLGRAPKGVQHLTLEVVQASQGTLTTQPCLPRTRIENPWHAGLPMPVKFSLIDKVSGQSCVEVVPVYERHLGVSDCARFPPGGCCHLQHLLRLRGFGVRPFLHGRRVAGVDEERRELFRHDAPGYFCGMQQTPCPVACGSEIVRKWKPLENGRAKQVARATAQHRTARVRDGESHRFELVETSRFSKP